MTIMTTASVPHVGYVLQEQDRRDPAFWRTTFTYGSAKLAAESFCSLKVTGDVDAEYIAADLIGGSIFSAWSPELAANIRVVPEQYIDIRCQWFGLCDGATVGHRDHPVLSQVSICERCNRRVTSAPPIRLAMIAPARTIHGLKDFPRDHAKRDTLETWCGKFPNPDALPLVAGEPDEINCATCLNTNRARNVGLKAVTR